MPEDEPLSVADVRKKSLDIFKQLQAFKSLIPTHDVSALACEASTQLQILEEPVAVLQDLWGGILGTLGGMSTHQEKVFFADILIGISCCSGIILSEASQQKQRPLHAALEHRLQDFCRGAYSAR